MSNKNKVPQTMTEAKNHRSVPRYSSRRDDEIIFICCCLLLIKAPVPQGKRGFNFFVYVVALSTDAAGQSKRSCSSNSAYLCPYD